MEISQLSIFIENQPGRLNDVCKFLGSNGINLKSLALADTSDFGILRLIADTPEKACKLLKDNGYTVNMTSVIAVHVKDEAGGLAEVLSVLENGGINIEYMYPFVKRTHSDYMIMIFRFDDIDGALKVLNEKNIAISKSADLYEV